jgi:flagellar biosynthetic protein FlhB
MADGAESGDRTKPATERRLQRAREDGEAPMSRELCVLAGLAAATLVLGMAGPVLARALSARLVSMLSAMDSTPDAALRDAGWTLLLAVMPLIAAVLLAGGMAVLLQTGGLMRGKALIPDLSRLSPKRGLTRLLGPDNLVEAVKSLAKVGVLAWAAWRALMDALPGATASVWWQPETLLDRVTRDLMHLCLLVLACQTAIAVLDLAWVRFRFAGRMRMSAQDIKQEHRESEGDPRLKAKLRQLRNARARRRMMAAVPSATVVITNPTHYAVALAYDRGTQSAPRVVAKGMDDVAARIRAMATEHGVPLVANPPLARMLHTLELDAEVPAEHFQAVAEIIAYVWRLRGKAANGG